MSLIDRFLGPTTAPPLLQLIDLRKLVLPPLHGERLARWEGFIEERMRVEVETWSVGDTFSLRPVVERVTLAVIMKAVPPRTMLIVPMAVIHQDPAIYPHPDAFRPEMHAPEARKVHGITVRPARGCRIHVTGRHARQALTR